MKKAIAIFGDEWHCVGPLSLAFSDKLASRGYDIDYVIDYSVPFDDLSEYDCIVLSKFGKDDRERYKDMDAYDDKIWMTAEQEDKFVEYVEGGGALFIHHDGFDYYRKGGGISSLARSYFIDHPPIGPINVRPVAGFDELNKDIEPYDIADEEYNVVMDESQTNVFLESYSEENGRKPQAWHHTQGKGKVAVFIPGHDHNVLSHPMVSRGIDNVVEWLNK